MKVETETLDQVCKAIREADDCYYLTFIENEQREWMEVMETMERASESIRAAFIDGASNEDQYRDGTGSKGKNLSVKTIKEFPK